MPTRLEVLNDGRGPIPDPPVVTPVNQRYGETVDAAWNDSDYGDFLARVPRVETGVTVTGDSVTLDRRGPVLTVQVTAARTLFVATKILTGSPAGGQVLVSYSSDGFPTLDFDSGDGVTEIAIEQLSPPALMDTLLSEEAGDA